MSRTKKNNEKSSNDDEAQHGMIGVFGIMTESSLDL